MKSITKYVANDGTEFNTKADCLRHEALIVEIDEIMSDLPELPKEDGCSFANGSGYIQHKAVTFFMVRERLLKIAKRFTDHKWIDQSIESPRTTHASWAGRIIDECCPRPLSRAWHRIYCTNVQSLREYGQPYYADHENEAKQVEVWS